MDERLEAMLRDAREGLSRSKVKSAEVFVHAADRGFARFSRGELDQHVELDERRAVVRAAVTHDGGAQIASVTTSDTSADGIARAAARAEHMAKVTPVTEGWPGFATRDEPAPRARASIAATMRSPEDRAKAVGRLLERCRERSLAAAGAFESSEHRSVIVNTIGLERAERTPFATCKVFALDAGGASGFAQQTRRSAEDIDIDAIAARAVDKCLAGRDPVVLPAGEYDVVLEPSAVVELLEWLAFTTFGAREVADGTSAFAGRLGERVTGENITLRDEGASDRSFSSAFDREGTARRSLVLIDRGVATSVVYDRLHGAREGRPSTGNAAPPSAWEDAPVAQSLVMDGGSDTLESLVAKVDRGLWITRFHYVNGFLDPRRTLMTGLTRDGTFVIERGARGRGVRNMRFTDSVFEALARCEGLSSLIEAVPTWWSDSGAFYAPSVLIRGLKFSGGGVEPPAA
ncbi:MAG: TldD/PmbA family protein [Myxococcales bacterium]|nr:TldD/PmbA family protein [Myxococcales bacterium]